MSRGWVDELANHAMFRESFLPMIEEMAEAVARSSMTGDGDEVSIAVARGEYAAYMKILNTFELEGADNE